MNQSKIDNQGLKFDLSKVQEPSTSELEEEKKEETNQANLDESILKIATDQVVTDQDTQLGTQRQSGDNLEKGETEQSKVEINQVIHRAADDSNNQTDSTKMIKEPQIIISNNEDELNEEASTSLLQALAEEKI